MISATTLAMYSAKDGTLIGPCDPWGEPEHVNPCRWCAGTGALDGFVDYDGDSEGFHPCHPKCEACDGSGDQRDAESYVPETVSL